MEMERAVSRATELTEELGVVLGYLRSATMWPGEPVVGDRSVVDTTVLGELIEALTLAEQAEKLKQAIADLPEPQRQVVCMRYYANMRFTEIAAAMGCPLNTALGRMHKAVLKLKQALEADS